MAAPTDRSRGSRAVTIADVCARDGLQTLGHDRIGRLDTAAKVELIVELDRAGLPEIEITGFVHPRVVPALADAEAVAHQVLARPLQARLRALVPNLKGAERAFATGLTKLSALIVASETYQRLNSRMSVDENLRQIESIAERCSARGVDLMAGVGTAFICPYEGVIPIDRLTGVIDRLVAVGVREVTLADSIGLAWPGFVRERIDALLQRWPDLEIGLHLHSLAGLALANAYAAYEAGVRRFDGSVGGIGGGIVMPVPAARMANVATEDLVYLFESSGVRTGIDAEAIAALALRMRERLGEGSGHVSGFGTLERFLDSGRAALAEKTMGTLPGPHRR